MAGLSPAPRQRLIGDLLHQGMLEAVLRLRRHATLKHQLQLDQALQPLHQYRLVVRRHQLDDLIGELPTEQRSPLGDVLGRTRAVQERHQRIVQTRWDGELGPLTDTLIALSGLCKLPRVQDHARQLLYKQRHPVRLLR